MYSRNLMFHTSASLECIEEFYPADVDFSKYLSMMNANGMMAMDNTSTAGDMMNDERWSPAGFDLVSLASTDTNQHSLCYPGERPSAGAAFIGTGMSLPMGSYSTSAGGLSSMTQSGAMKLTGATTKNDVILIPPTLPRHVPAPASSITSATTAMPPPSADVKAASGNKRSASSMLRDSGGKARASSTYHGKGDSVDGQRFERRYAFQNISAFVSPLFFPVHTTESFSAFFSAQLFLIIVF